VALDRMLHSPWGRVLKAIREDETAAIALGKSAAQFRIQAFVLGSMLMGLAGALYVSFIGFVSPFDFLPILTFQIWAMVIHRSRTESVMHILAAAMTRPQVARMKTVQNARHQPMDFPMAMARTINVMTIAMTEGRRAANSSVELSSHMEPAWHQ